MRGETDIRLNVKMDVSQARAEAVRLQREVASRFRTPTESDARTVAADKKAATAEFPFRPNPYNPDLAYSPTKHTGIWWARQKGIRGLGNPEYRHQFFTKREAEYMGKQFAKAARNDLIAAGKNFGIAAVGFIAGEGTRLLVNYLSVPGRNNRKAEVVGSYTSGILTGAAGGAMAGATVGSVVPVVGTGVGAIAGGLIGALGGVVGGVNTQIGHRNEDEIVKMNDRLSRLARQHQRTYARSDMALGEQLNLMPSRSGKMALIARQIQSIQSGKGDETIDKLRAEEEAMMHGTEYNGVKYRLGDINTMRGQYVTSTLRMLEARRETLSAQYEQLKYTKPHAKPIDAVTDDYSRRGLYAGGQVSVQDVNTIIVDKMKTIIGLLESIRKGSSADKPWAQATSGYAQW